MVHPVLNHVVQRTGLLGTVAENEHLAGIHHGAHTHRQGLLGHLRLVVVEEAAVSLDGIGGKGFDAGTAGEAGARLVEGDVAVGAYAAHEKVDAAGLGNHLLVVGALRQQVGRIAVEDVHILGLDVDVAEEVGPHEAVVALGMLHIEAHILVHVERHHILEADFAFLVELHQMLVQAERRTTGGASQHKRTLRRGFEIKNTFGHIVGSPN